MNKKENKLVVIVESPAKAATIEKYLGSDYKVLASYGHVRDLLNKTGSVNTENDFSMTWANTEKSEKHIKDILSAAENGKGVLLATDPDREGEAIAWHISEIIKERFSNIPMQRVVFYEITKNAILNAVNAPKQIDNLLVDAYLARRALDYLVGYNISPILWQKLPGARSAGRVQSVALRMIVEREQEIEKFISQEYWTITGTFLTPQKNKFSARLSIYDGKKLGKFDIQNLQEASKISETLKAFDYSILSVEKKQIKRNPVAPFTTSTMQQEAARKLGFGASKTMRTAQRLYEGIQIDGEMTGLITYMRTDSTNLSKEAVSDIRDFILNNFGDKYLPEEAKVYKTKAKNAQEAHEAIRPTSALRDPKDLASFLDKDQFDLYELVWNRAISSQMESAIYDQVSAEIGDATKKNIFKAVGTTQVFDGFLVLYQEGVDEESPEENPNQAKLPILEANQPAGLADILDHQHFTQPPGRFTEASLVKKLEELGIGRPSTYAPLMHVLQERQYVILEKKQFSPSDRGRIVTAFLSNFCRKYVEYDFTAHMEEELDDISSGKINWKNVIGDFWTDFSGTVQEMKKISVTEVIDKLESDMENYIFKNTKDRTCDVCNNGTIGLKLSKFGAFLGCSNYPECKNKKMIGLDIDSPENSIFESVELGTDQSDNSKISLKKGPYGFYVEVEFAKEDENKIVVKELKPGSKRKVKSENNLKRIGLPNGMDHLNLTFEDALFLKSLPKELGIFEDGTVTVHTGRFGPYVKHLGIIASIPKSINFEHISLQEAIELINRKKAKPAKSFSYKKAAASKKGSRT